MKKIETPLTWALGILSILLITFAALNSTTKNYNLGNASSDNNNYWDLNYEHELKESSDFSLLKIYGPWGEESCDSNTENIEDSIRLQEPPPELILHIQRTFNYTKEEAIDYLHSDTILIDVATESKMITDTILLD